ATALRSHRLPAILESALLREAALSGNGLERAVAARLRPEPIDFTAARSIILFGPSGSGKSLVAAKIAGAALQQGRSARIVAGAHGLNPARDELIIADCEGFNPRNAKARAAFAALGEVPDAQVIGVLSALSDAEEISEIMMGFAMRRVIMTGLDMTRRAGALAAASLQGASLVHVTRGACPGNALENMNAAAMAALLATPASAG
ncbi:MAG TPA: hypothetical protein VIJ72_03455, partial [Rhizomicrobium sp.]